MSGHKKSTVTISQEEYRRLYEAEKKLEYSAICAPQEAIQGSLYQAQQDHYSEYINLETRQNDYDRVIQGFNDQLRDIELTAAQSLVNQQVEFINQINSSSNQILENAVNFIDFQTREIENQVIQQHDHLQEQFLVVEKRVNRLFDRSIEIQEEANHWIQDGISLHQFIQNHYEVEFFCPLENQRATRQLEIAIANFNNNFGEAALTTGQQAVIALTDLRLQLEKNQNEWNSLRIAVRNTSQILWEKIQSNRICFAIDMNGNLIDHEIEVDFWTNGLLSTLESQIQKILMDIASTEVCQSKGELKNILMNTLPSIENDIDKAIHLARYQSLISQLRFNIANLALISLVQQGFKPVNGGYENGDFQSDYVAQAINHEGSEVIIRVVPNSASPMQNQLHIISNDPILRSESELQQRASEITRNLSNQGLDVTNPIEIHDFESRKKTRTSPTNTKLIHQSQLK